MKDTVLLLMLHNKINTKWVTTVILFTVLPDFNHSSTFTTTVITIVKTMTLMILFIEHNLISKNLVISYLFINNWALKIRRVFQIVSRATYNTILSNQCHYYVFLQKFLIHFLIMIYILKLIMYCIKWVRFQIIF